MNNINLYSLFSVWLIFDDQEEPVDNSVSRIIYITVQRSGAHPTIRGTDPHESGRQTWSHPVNPRCPTADDGSRTGHQPPSRSGKLVIYASCT